MNSLLKNSLVCWAFSLCSIASAQSYYLAAVPFLLQSPSPQANAMGTAYGATAHASPMASIMNPASAGLFARSNAFGSEYYPDPIEYGADERYAWSYTVRGATLGFRTRPIRNVQLAIGLAFNDVKLDLGKVYVTDESSPDIKAIIDTWEKAQGTTLSLALQYYLRASFGYTFKHIESQLAAYPDDPGKPMTAQIDAHDFGIIVQLPIADLTQRWTHRGRGRFAQWRYWLDPGIYYTRNNIGGKLKYLAELPGDPLPRTLDMGLNLQAGVQYRDLTLVNFGWAHEVEDFLVHSDELGQSSYHTGLHDIHFWKHVIAGKSSRDLISKKGYEIGLADMYFIRRGLLENPENLGRLRTSGYGINFLQPVRIGLRLLNMERTWLARVLANLSFEKHHSEFQPDGFVLSITEYDTYVIRFSNNYF